MGRLFEASDSRTVEEKQAQAILLQTEFVLSEMVHLHEALRETIWNIPDLDAREFNAILEVLGTDGPKVKAVLSGLSSMINAAAPNTLSEEQVADPIRLTNTNGTLRADVRGTYPGRK